MDERLINKLKSLFDDIIHVSEDGEIEFWYARELQPLLGYARWENFELVVKKAKAACENAGGNIEDHFRDVTKMIKLAKNAEREVKEYCYLCKFKKYMGRESPGIHTLRASPLIFLHLPIPLPVFHR